MTVVYFANPVNGDRKLSCKSVTVQVSGWVTCYHEDGSYEAFPPHKVTRVVEPNPEDKHRGEKLTSESPHGQV